MARSELIGIRVTKSELLDLWTGAIDADLTLSEFVRVAALERARQPTELRGPDGPPLDAFVSDDQQVNTVLAKMPRRRSEDV